MRPYRKERIAIAVRNIVGEAIAHKMHDPRVQPLSNVTRVELSGDLQLAKVYLSIPGGEVAERKTLAAIKHATGYLQGMVASQLQIRQCPELRFLIDERIKGTLRTMQLLAENRRKYPEVFKEDDEVPMSNVESQESNVESQEANVESQESNVESQESNVESQEANVESQESNVERSKEVDPQT